MIYPSPRPFLDSRLLLAVVVIVAGVAAAQEKPLELDQAREGEHFDFFWATGSIEPDGLDYGVGQAEKYYVAVRDLLGNDKAGKPTQANTPGVSSIFSNSVPTTSRTGLGNGFGKGGLQGNGFGNGGGLGNGLGNGGGQGHGGPGNGGGNGGGNGNGGGKGKP